MDDIGMSGSGGSGVHPGDMSFMQRWCMYTGAALIGVMAAYWVSRLLGPSDPLPRIVYVPIDTIDDLRTARDTRERRTRVDVDIPSTSPVPPTMSGDGKSSE